LSQGSSLGDFDAVADDENINAVGNTLGFNTAIWVINHCLFSAPEEPRGWREVAEGAEIKAKGRKDCS
jgi:hypothetical protein